MVDSLTPEQRKWTMSRVRSKNTKPEVTVRRLLHSLGYRFRLHRDDLPGKPDIVLPKYRTAVFVHGCFWHRHVGCKRCTTPSSNYEYWTGKFARNVDRDRRNRAALEALGWNVLVVWECELRDLERLAERLDIELSGDLVAYPESAPAALMVAEAPAPYQ